MISRGSIELRGVNVHNLNYVDLDLDRGKLFVFCGVSGSGKTSLALDTLYAEGQRRYIESFSAYTRQFLERLDKPDAESIEGLPPAIAVIRTQPSLSNRSTVGTSTDAVEYLRLLFAKVASASCPTCQTPILVDSPPTIAEWIQGLPVGTRLMVASPVSLLADRNSSQQEELIEQGFVRAVYKDEIVELANLVVDPASESNQDESKSLDVVVDRLVAGDTNASRTQETLETAMRLGESVCHLYIEASPAVHESFASPNQRAHQPVSVSSRDWLRVHFSSELNCGRCGRQLPRPEPRLFSFNSPLGACQTCEGFGNILVPDMSLIVPDPSKSLKEGAIAPWSSKAYVKEQQLLLKLAPASGIDVDKPFRDLTAEQVTLIRQGIPDSEFMGIEPFFQWLEKRAFKTHHRAFLSRWRSEEQCPACHGSRLRDDSRAFRISGRSIDEVCQMEIRTALDWIAELAWPAQQQIVANDVCRQIESRLSFLAEVGLGYLTLDRSLRTLSGGEAQRVALTSALGSTLVSMLYLLDEPTVGLHPEDVARLQASIFALRDRGNTVVVVEHEPELIAAADEVIEIGPGAGDAGGSIVFQGPPSDMLESSDSITADFLTGKRGATLPTQRRTATHGRIKLNGARGNNLKNISVEFPLGLLCLVTGVSGAGKSTLVQDTLYGAICRRKRKEAAKTLPFDDVLGDGQIEEVVLVDQSPIGRTPRSNPVTYIKAFDDIRGVFAEHWKHGQEISRRATLVSMSTGAVVPNAKATVAFRSTCNFWPTSICVAHSAKERVTARKSSTSPTVA